MDLPLLEKINNSDDLRKLNIGELNQLCAELREYMLEVVSKKLDTMNPEDLTQGNVTDWVQTAIRAEREAEFPTSRNSTLKQGELLFVPDFQGL